MQRYDGAPEHWMEDRPMRSSLLFVALFALTGGVAVAQDTAGTGLVQAKAPDGARAFIVSPKDGDTVGQDVHVVFGIEGMSIAATTKSAANSGHHHLLIDQSELPMREYPIPSDEFHKHYGAGQTEDTIRLEPGTHTLQLDFADGRHVQFDPPVVSEMITIQVK
jgi:hypothetical protein